MITSLNTANPPGAAAPSGLPDPAVLARLANEFFAALPGASGGSALNVAPAATSAAPLGDLPDEADFRKLPAVLAGGSGQQPAALATAPSGDEGAAPLYFLRATQPPPPRSAPLVALKTRDGEFEFPELADIPSPGERSGVPGSQPAGTGWTPPQGSPMTGGGELSALSFYFLDELHSTSGASQPEPARPGSGPGPSQTSAHPGFDVLAVRRDFPILQERVHGRPLIWLDNAATTQKPQAVIDRLAYFYAHENSNIHRAAHELAARATDAYEAARDKVARFLNAASSDEIVFVRGTTEGINLIAQSWGRRHLGKDDEIVISWLEHHANIVPWQRLCAETGARLRVAPVDERGQIRLDEYERLFNARTKLVAFSQVSNALGTVTPAKEMIEIAHRHGARVLLDGAQAVSHMRADVQALDCDWYVFSGHKVFGPTGIGAVYGKLDLLNAMPPWQGGGNMIQDVTFELTVYHGAPARFEAGTGNIADAVGLGAALDYVARIGIDNIQRYEHELLCYATEGLLGVPGLTLIGTAPDKAGVLSFVLRGFRPEAVGEALNREGIAVRSGHHCAQPILRRFGQEATVRPSLAFYNTREEIDTLVDTVRRIQGGSHGLRR
ncbi:cysteine desulfurase / selenocysteine lyase [Methylomagnum ishizawai]|uniref:cysteine desulfurase n=1 Tax=Methylomagnum ishizawai TaxID=1760988 RepID=A0A1Y6D3K2_9GAMM|nr:family 2A encapsulin nanocompartment cargo protein cysteine desulfurase [Methylomagnum ishizawai]SMF95122.1 cysteine desulfurase / selenocysteine lyase [Methylomagnum ishizawai]